MILISKKHFHEISNGCRSERSRLEQRSVVKCFMAEKYKEWGKTVYEDCCSSQKYVYKWDKNGFVKTSLSKKETPLIGNTLILQ